MGRNRIVRSTFALVMISSVGESMMGTLFPCGTGPIVAAVIFRLIAGRGPDPLTVPVQPSDVEGAPIPRQATTMPA